MRKKSVAVLLALLFGWMGAHRFYLGQRVLGLIMMSLCLIGIWQASVPVYFPIVLVSIGLWWILDFLLFLTMPVADFDRKYNAEFVDRGQKRKWRRTAGKRSKKKSMRVDPEFQRLKEQGINALKEYELQQALHALKEAVRLYADDEEIHFHLACVYSLLEMPYPAMYHLAQAVSFGFADLDQIETHEALAFLRTHPDFRAFQQRGYRYEDPQDTSLQLEAPSDDGPNLLAQLKVLQDLRQRGLLTKEEYEQERARIELKRT